MKYKYNSIKKSLHPNESWFNVLILKYITLPLVYLIVNYTKITPNGISLISLVLGLASAYSYYKGSVLLGGILYLLSYIFDAIDGKVARITQKGKAYGSWLDIFIDRINLVLISTAIAYNYYQYTNDVSLIFLNSIFLGLVFIGSESRYNINYYKLKNNTENEIKKQKKSKYEEWCDKKGLIKSPISLPELFLFYLIISPQLKIEKYSIIVLIIFLIIRIIAQQKFWFNVSKNK